MSVPLNKTIGLRLLRYVFGCYFAVTVVVTSIQLILEYTHVKEGVFIELSHLGETLESGLATSIWNYDVPQVESILLGINKIAIVEGTKATTDQDELLATSGEIIDPKKLISKVQQPKATEKGVINKLDYIENGEETTAFEYQFPIYYEDTDAGTTEFIGYCYIYAKHSLIIERVKYGFFLIIINASIKTAALWFIFLFFTKRIIAEPLNMLTRATKEMDPDNPQSFRNNQNLEKIYFSGHDDELHILTDSFLKMRNTIIEKFNIIEQHNTTLEHRVKERTEKIEEVNKELKHLSLHDPLTGLPNRNLFHDRLEHLLTIAKRDKFEFAIASIDLRKFKQINDNFGHQAGDKVLTTLSKRMSNVTRSVDTIARMGGDEFAMLVQDVDQETIEAIGEKIAGCAHKPITFEDNNIQAGLNIGFSIYPDHADNATELFKKADIAMYQAKKNDRNITLYTAGVDDELERRDIIRQDLGTAISRNQLDIFYQPIVHGETHSIDNVEALIRWKHPTLGFVPPDEFIAIAERSNLIKRFTEWVTHRVLSDGEIFIKQGYNFNISINISGMSINDASFPSQFKEIIDQYTFPAEKIKLELTESCTVKNHNKSLQTLYELKDIGVSLSIDDFGTGYSSFSYLTRLPVDELKIDRSFLINFNEKNRAVVESLVSLAHKLKLEVVCEGIETEDVLLAINSLKCDHIQGYYYSRPLPFSDLITWIDGFTQHNTSDDLK